MSGSPPSRVGSFSDLAPSTPKIGGLLGAVLIEARRVKQFANLLGAIPVLRVFEELVQMAAVDHVGGLLAHLGRVLVIPVDDVVVQQNHNVAFPLSVLQLLLFCIVDSKMDLSTGHELGEDDLLQELGELETSSLIGQLVE